MIERPLIWVLQGLRAGDTAQAMEIALQLGGRVEAKQLEFNWSHAVPNFLLGARISHLNPDVKNLLRPPWPDVVVATGRRSAPVALWIKKQSGGKTKLLQIGRPRMALSHFDCVVTTPQYGLPGADNVVTLSMPFASPKVVAEDQLQMFEEMWRDLPKPWFLAVVGGNKFPLKLDSAALLQFGEALQQRVQSTGGSIILLDSPRSPHGSLHVVSQQLRVPHWQFRRGESSNPYHAALKLCDELVVTGDSVSMVAEMVATGKPAWIFRLAVSPIAFRWSAQHGPSRILASLGILNPPRHVDGFMQNLIDQKLVGDLVSGNGPIAQSRGYVEQSKSIAHVRSALKI